MRSFRLIGKYSHPHHRVLTMEKPKKSVYKFYSPARSCMQTLLHNIPAHRPRHREKRPCLSTFVGVSAPVPVQPYTTLMPRFPGIFILPQRHLPERDFLVQVNPAQINTRILIVFYPYPHTLHQHGSHQS